jgi:hypothetical protein
MSWNGSAQESPRWLHVVLSQRSFYQLRRPSVVWPSRIGTGTCTPSTRHEVGACRGGDRVPVLVKVEHHPWNGDFELAGLFEMVLPHLNERVGRPRRWGPWDARLDDEYRNPAGASRERTSPSGKVLHRGG